MSAHGPMPRSAWIFPALAVLLFVVASALGLTFTPSAGGLAFAAVLLAILFGTVFAAVHHAEVIAERIGIVASSVPCMTRSGAVTRAMRWSE